MNAGNSYKIICIGLLAALCVLVAGVSARSSKPVGAVYVMSNAPDGNRLVIFDRYRDGSLVPAGSLDTQGLGSGGDNIDPLRSQGSLIADRNGRLIVAVNAGSNDLSVFKASRKGLTFLSKIESGGTLPNSLALNRKTLYVLNRTGSTIAGYTINRRGDISALPGSVLTLPEGLYSQIGFSPKGDFLLLMESTQNQMLAYPVAKDGVVIDNPIVTSSTGSVPFAFSFYNRNRLVVAEAGSGSVSSHELQKDGSLETITPPLANGQRATCWIEVNNRGFVYVTNTASDNLSIYQIDRREGSLSLIEAAIPTGDGPIDLSIAKNRFVYILNGADGTVSIFEINRKDGLLTELEGSPVSHPDLPTPYAQGIIAR